MSKEKSTMPAATEVAKVTQTSAADAKAEADAAQHEVDAAALAETDADALAAVRKRNAGLDPVSPADRIKLHLPTSSKRVFVHVAEVFDLKGRLGGGPCKVLKRFALPCGDLALVGDTFDPVEEKMGPNRYRSLLSRKFFTGAGPEVEDKLIRSGDLAKK